MWSDASLARGVTWASARCARRVGDVGRDSGRPARQRPTVVRLRDEHRVGNTVPRKARARVDIEDARLSRRELVDRPVGYGSR